MVEGVEPNTQDCYSLLCEPLAGISVIGYMEEVGELKKYVKHFIKGAYLSTAIVFVGSFLVLVGRLASCCVHEQYRTPEDPLSFSMCIAAFCFTQICSTVPYALLALESDSEVLPRCQTNSSLGAQPRQSVPPLHILCSQLCRSS